MAVLMTASGVVLSNNPGTAIVVLIVILCCATLGGAYRLVRRLVNRVGTVSAEIAVASDQLINAAAQLASASRDLAQGVCTESESLSETSGTCQLMASITKQSAESSQSAMQLTGQADELATQATRGLEVMVHSIEEIGASASKISHIIKVVDEIAFQSNILALNAAVEAARAGEAGAGFAVVAEEVRNLSKRSAQAAQDIASLVEESLTRTKEGTAKLDQVSEAMRALIANTNQVKEFVDEMSMSSEGLAKGTEQISTSMMKLEELTQKTAASSEQTAATSEEMNAQAESMRHLVTDLHALSDSNV